jgi:hypothetical protein
MVICHTGVNKIGDKENFHKANFEEFPKGFVPCGVLNRMQSW